MTTVEAQTTGVIGTGTLRKEVHGLAPASPMRVWSTIQTAKSASSAVSGGAK
jgi:hypothetical protein